MATNIFINLPVSVQFLPNIVRTREAELNPGREWEV